MSINRRVASGFAGVLDIDRQLVHVSSAAPYQMQQSDDVIVTAFGGDILLPLTRPPTPLVQPGADLTIDLLYIVQADSLPCVVKGGPNLINGLASITVPPNSFAQIVWDGAEWLAALSGSSGGVKAYGYLFSGGLQSVVGFVDVTFTSIGPSSNMTNPAPGGTTFTVVEPGDYKFHFHVRGFATEEASNSDNLNFGLFVNGLPAAGGIFAAGQQVLSVAMGGAEALDGDGIVTLAAGDLVTLRNLTLDSGSAPATVTLPALPEALNATLSLELLS